LVNYKKFIQDMEHGRFTLIFTTYGIGKVATTTCKHFAHLLSDHEKWSLW